jgi:hypothetical protein
VPDRGFTDTRARVTLVEPRGVVVLGYAIVMVLAVAVGMLVYRISMSVGATTAPADVEEWRATASGTNAPAAEPNIMVGGPEGEHYIPVSAGRPSWHSRLGGAMGLLVAVTAAALILAFTLYETGSLIVRLLSSAAKP